MSRNRKAAYTADSSLRVRLLCHIRLTILLVGSHAADKKRPSHHKTDTYIEVLPLSVTKHSGALCIFMLLSEIRIYLK